MKIMLVDDERELVTTLAERLDIRGIEARWFTSAEEALAAARKEIYDLAVLDIKMPKINGIELRNQLRKIHPKMRFIFLTGHGSEEDYRLGATDGACYLVKPIHIDQLIERMNEIRNAGEETPCR